MSVKRHKGSFSVDEEYVDELAGHSRFKEVSSNEFKHVISSLEKAILKNQDYRMKFAGNPNKIYESERELFEELNALVLLTTNESFCLEFLKSETAMSLAALLEHENLAIVVCSLKFFNEIIDVDENSNSRNSFLDDLFAMLLKLPLVELIFVLFRRSAETVMLEDEDYIEAFHLGFQLLQNLLELNASDVVDSLSSSTLLKSLITWFIENLNLNFDADIGAFVNIVPCLVAETLLSLITASEKARIIFCNGGGIKCLLDLLAHYTVALPKSGDEGEYVENLFDILCSALFLESSKREFVDLNGFDMLASIYANSKKKNTEKVLKALDFAITTPNGHEFICNFVFSSSKNPGLSIPFECLRSSSIPIFERSVSVIFSLLMFARTKSLEKNCKTILLCFCADNFSLILTLLSQRQGYVVKFTQLRQEFLELSDEDFREIQYEEGLLTLQQIDIILLCCCDNIIPHMKEAILLLLQDESISILPEELDHSAQSFLELQDDSTLSSAISSLISVYNN